MGGGDMEGGGGDSERNVEGGAKEVCNGGGEGEEERAPEEGTCCFGWVAVVVTPAVPMMEVPLLLFMALLVGVSKRPSRSTERESRITSRLATGIRW